MPAAYQRRQHTIFSTVQSEGAILPMDLLQRISDPQNAQLEGLTPQDYGLDGVRLNEAINKAWSELLGVWQRFQSERERLPEYDAGTTLTRDRWLRHLFRTLGYGDRLPTTKALAVGERTYAISHKWGDHTPIHLVSFRVDLDKSVQGEHGARRNSPHSLLQELLNRSNEYLWGMVSNGKILRILRNNVSLTRQAYVEFDLEKMFHDEIYADFVLLWLLCHESRVYVEGERPEGCWLEKWSKEAHATGTRALDHLRDGVERAISELGSGFLAYRENEALREKLRDGSLSALEYYNQLLRLVYRLLVLFVAEDRDILFDPDALDAAKNIYREYYSTTRLRVLADRQLGTRHTDLYYSLKLVMQKLGEEDGCRELGLPGLNGFLFSPAALADLRDCQLANYALLAAIRHLAYTESGRTRRIIDYKNLGSEELGSVYESLLELHPEFHLKTGKFELVSASGNARKTTGSYYTPTSLITCLLDSALDPVLNEAAAKSTQAEAEAAILNLKICDPACGSGHFLVAAAHRVAKKLAAVRTGDEEPSLDERRKALREIVGRCVYGVDLNPMAVELCKVSLWMEAIVPGKPLSFLDAHIQCGNSLLGTTPKLLKDPIGIPDSAFEAIEGDDKKICSGYKKRNREERAGQLNLWDSDSQPWEHQGMLEQAMRELDEMSEDTVAQVRQKQQAFEQTRASGPYENAKLWADAWCAAFVWKKIDAMYPPIATEEFRKIGKSPFTLAPWRKAEIERLAQQYQFFHWHIAFPDVFRVPTNPADAENEQAGWSGGFDVVLGNPPWERIKIQEKEWFATRQPEIASAANAAARKKLIEQLKSGRDHEVALYTAFLEDLRQAEGESQFVRRSGRYPLCGRGDVNTYSIFAENMRNAVSPRGRLGCIVPSGIATDDTTKFFFQDLMETRSLASLYDFENRGNFFPDFFGMLRFCLITVVGKECTISHGAEFAFFTEKIEELQENERRFTVNASDIALFNPNTHTCPIFRSNRDMRITKAIYRRVPVLIKEGTIEENPWQISFNRMFDMSNDSHLFRTGEKLEAEGWKLIGNTFHKGDEQYLPLYEGKMIWHFDHRLANAEEPKGGSFTKGSSTKLTDEDHNNPNNLPLPRYWVHEVEMPDYTRDGRLALQAFRDVVGAANARTAIFSLVPVIAIGHTMPIVITKTKHSYEQAFLNASLSSFAFDYIARQKLGGIHMTFFILKQLPVLPPATYAQACQWDECGTLGEWILPRALELTYTAWDLEAFAKDCGYAGPPFRWDEQRRFLLRCELDAAYFHLYGIAREDVEYIMETFPIVKREDEKLHKEYRTKRVILEIYDEMARAMETSGTYATRLVPGPADPVVAHPAR